MILMLYQKGHLSLNFPPDTYLELSQKVKAIRQFGQLIRYDVRNIFHEKSYRKYGEESNLGPFLKTG